MMMLPWGESILQEWNWPLRQLRIGKSSLGLNRASMLGSGDVFPGEKGALNRRLDDTATTCTASHNRLNTTYNDNEDVPPYAGIMFEMLAHDSALEILTFEVDVRLDLVPKAVIEEGLVVEVYTLEDEFADFVNTPSAWELVADTYAVVAADGNGIIIPSLDFATVRLEPHQKRSFYITFRYQYLDHNVNAMMKTGEEQFNIADMEVLVGGGTTLYKFPEEIDTLVDPQFAGVIHYNKIGNCDAMVTTTLVYYPYLVPIDPSPELVLEFTLLLEEAIQILFSTHDALKDYHIQFGLQLSHTPTTATADFSGSCPPEFKFCPTKYLYPTITLHHHSHLETGDVEYEMYRQVPWLTRFLNKRISDPGVTELVYGGHSSWSARFTIILDGVPENASMDEIQTEYFCRVTTAFLDNTEAVAVYATSVEKQDWVGSDSQGNGRRQQQQREVGWPARSLRRMQNDEEQLGFQIQGRIKGIAPASFNDEKVQYELESTVRMLQDQYLHMFAVEYFKPPDDMQEQGRYKFFQDLSSVGSIMEVDTISLALTNVNDSGSPLAAIIIVCILGVIFMIGLWLYTRRHLKQKAEDDKDKEALKRLRSEQDAADRKARLQKLWHARHNGTWESLEDDGNDDNARPGIRQTKSVGDLIDKEAVRPPPPQRAKSVDEEEFSTRSPTSPRSPRSRQVQRQDSSNHSTSKHSMAGTPKPPLLSSLDIAETGRASPANTRPEDGFGEVRAAPVEDRQVLMSPKRKSPGRGRSLSPSSGRRSPSGSPRQGASYVMKASSQGTTNSGANKPVREGEEGTLRRKVSDPRLNRFLETEQNRMPRKPMNSAQSVQHARPINNAKAKAAREFEDAGAQDDAADEILFSRAPLALPGKPVVPVQETTGDARPRAPQRMRSSESLSSVASGNNIRSGGRRPPPQHQAVPSRENSSRVTGVDHFRGGAVSGPAGLPQMGSEPDQLDDLSPPSKFRSKSFDDGINPAPTRPNAPRRINSTAASASLDAYMNSNPQAGRIAKNSAMSVQEVPRRNTAKAKPVREFEDASQQLPRQGVSGHPEAGRDPPQWQRSQSSGANAEHTPQSQRPRVKRMESSPVAPVGPPPARMLMPGRAQSGGPSVGGGPAGQNPLQRHFDGQPRPRVVAQGAMSVQDARNANHARSKPVKEFEDASAQRQPPDARQPQRPFGRGGLEPGIAPPRHHSSDGVPIRSQTHSPAKKPQQHQSLQQPQRRTKSEDGNLGQFIAAQPQRPNPSRGAMSVYELPVTGNPGVRPRQVREFEDAVGPPQQQQQQQHHQPRQQQARPPGHGGVQRDTMPPEQAPVSNGSLRKTKMAPVTSSKTRARPVGPPSSQLGNFLKSNEGSGPTAVGRSAMSVQELPRTHNKARVKPVREFEDATAQQQQTSNRPMSQQQRQSQQQRRVGGSGGGSAPERKPPGRIEEPLDSLRESLHNEK